MTCQSCLGTGRLALTERVCPLCHGTGMALESPESHGDGRNPSGEGQTTPGSPQAVYEALAARWEAEAETTVSGTTAARGWGRALMACARELREAAWTTPGGCCPGMLHTAKEHHDGSACWDESCTCPPAGHALPHPCDRDRDERSEG